jgi:hypothetical protein
MYFIITDFGQNYKKTFEQMLAMLKKKTTFAL